MAVISGGLGTSHVQGIGAAIDQGLTQEPYWKPLFDGYQPAREWLAQIAPDVVILVYNDHGSAFSMEYIPAFAIGVADQFQPADEGWGPRPVPVVRGDPDLAWYLAESLILDDFDMTIMNVMDVDHGLTVPLSITCGQVQEWPFRVIPIAVNTLVYPVPSARRCHALGQAIGRAVAAYTGDLKVVVFGTGGLSHQLHGERAGLINTDWDQRFLDDISADPRRLVTIPHLEYVREAGAEGSEMVMWLVMRGTLDERVREVYRHYHVPASNTAAGLIILENA